MQSPVYFSFLMMSRMLVEVQLPPFLVETCSWFSSLAMASVPFPERSSRKMRFTNSDCAGSTRIGYVDRLETPTSVASGIFVIRNTRQAEISTQFIYYLLKSRLFKAFITSRTEGSVIPHLYQKDFMEFEFQLPSQDEMKIFDDTTAAMFSMVFSNLTENERLIHLRDSLLPMLMSGELDISDIDI